MSDLFRVYGEVGTDGYPPEWHKLLYDDLQIGVVTEREPGIKHLVREQAGHRCVRCGHPYRNGEHGDGEWSPCDACCTHDGPFRVETTEGWRLFVPSPSALGIRALRSDFPAAAVEARWRILTVHHLNGDKADCRWWNLAALCQRCHLTIQGRVQLHRVWPWEHSEWFKPYAAGWYAHAYLGEDISREEAVARLDELLALERAA